MNTSHEQSIRQFWDQRSTLGVLAGTNDFVLSGIEQAFLVDTIEQRSRVLDVGCGNGSTLVRLAKDKACTGVGIDFSDAMIARATEAAEANGTSAALQWFRCELPPVPAEWGVFDTVYSQRSLINLTSTAQQKASVLSVPASLKSGGRYIMVECFNEGAAETNELRLRLGLEAMEAPWHNLFLDLHEVKNWSTPEFYVEKVVHVSSTYHFLSRVVYAQLARDAGETLAYDSAINLLAARLPQEIGEFGPVKACIWRKA